MSTEDREKDLFLKPDWPCYGVCEAAVRCAARMFHVAWWGHDAEKLHSLVHEVQIKYVLYARRNAVRNPAGLVRAIAPGVVANRLKAARRRACQSLDKSVAGRAADTSRSDRTAAAVRRRFEAVRDALTPEQRLIVDYIVAEQLDVRKEEHRLQVARQFGKSGQGMRKILSRIRAKARLAVGR